MLRVVEREEDREGGGAMHAIRVSRTGDPSVLEYVSVEKPIPGKGEALVRVDIGDRKMAEFTLPGGCMVCGGAVQVRVTPEGGAWVIGS